MRRLFSIAFFSLIIGVSIARADDTDRRFVQAQQLIFLGRYDQALQLIEGLTPVTEAQWTRREDLLLQAYQGQKNYAALDNLVHQALERNPERADRSRWEFIRAELYLKADHPDSARALLDRLWKAQPTDSVVIAAARLYEQHALADWALGTYQEARKLASDTSRFAYELALLYEARRDYAQAVAEYFLAMERDSASARGVENRVLELVQTDESRASIEAALMAAAQTKHTKAPANRLLTALYLETGRPDLALKSAWIVDSLTNQRGMSLVLFLRQASERGYYGVAAQAAETVVSRYPDSPVRHQAEWEMAKASAHSGDVEGAAKQYREIARSSPAVRFRMEAALEYGDLERHLRHLDAADSTYLAILATQPLADYLGRATLGRALVAEARGRLDSARAILLDLAKTDPRGAVREEMTYRLAELTYFDGNLEGALDAFKALATDYSRSVWVNDALRRALLLTAYREIAEGDVRALASAEMQSRWGAYDSALTRIAGMRLSPETPLSPAATLLAAEIHLAAARPESALALWDLFVTTYPEHSDAAYALAKAAELCDGPWPHPELALTRYREILEKYPDSHYAELARRRVRALGQF
jgi:tetratricopeptide (TPR) repeat protein